DIIDAEPLEAGIERPRQAFAMHTGGIGIARTRYCVGIFGCDDVAIAVGLDQPAYDPFALAARVHVGGVDEVTACFGKSVEYWPAFFFGPRPFDRGPKCHGTERDLRYAQAAFTKQAVSHQTGSPRPGLSRQASSGNGMTPSCIANSRKFQCVRQRTILPSR